MKEKKSALYLAQAAIIAALYVVLTWIANLFGLASGAIQVRLSEALTILPVFTPASIPGLFVGCILANLLTGCAPWDVVFGSIATLLGALGTWAIARSKLPRSAKEWTACLPPIISNVLIVPWVISIVYEATESIPFLMLTVGVGEVISCGILGMCLYLALKPRSKTIFAE
ncbi:MAG: QueT transporter family protein [Lachnospiraceae bacterium]|nr:QueT transporter family protein [Lachnospiraceae bacterium]